MFFICVHYLSNFHIAKGKGKVQLESIHNIDQNSVFKPWKEVNITAGEQLFHITHLAQESHLMAIAC